MLFFRRRYKIIGIALLSIWLLLEWGNISCADMLVIGNLKLKANSLTTAQISNLYLGRASTVDDQTITPINLSTQNPDYAQFYRSFTGWGMDQVSSYWAQQVFSGTAQQPLAVGDMSTAIAYVRAHPGAIAYVNSDEIKNAAQLAGVKILYGHYSGIDGAGSPMPSHPATQLPGPHGLVSSTALNGYAAQAAKLYATHTALASPAGNPTSLNLNLPSIAPADNLWQQIQLHMKLQQYFNLPAVQQQRAILLADKSTFNMILRNAIPYIAYVYQQTQLRHQPAELALLPMLESQYNPYAYSRVGAAGLWQMMPATATLYGLKINWWYDARRDVLLSTRAALNFLNTLYSRFKSWPLALASYDAGGGTVGMAIKRNQSQNLGTQFWQLNLPGETQAYVPKLLAIASIIDNPQAYGINLPELSVTPFFTTVTLNSQMDLESIAQMAAISVNLIRYLNPGLRRFATSSAGAYTLLLPVYSLNTFIHNYTQHVGKKYMSWQYHEVTGAETLAKIAADYHVKVDRLMQVNNLNSAALSANEGILVPINLGLTYAKLGEVGGERQTAAIQSVSVKGLLSGDWHPNLLNSANMKPLGTNPVRSRFNAFLVQVAQWVQLAISRLYYALL